MESQENQVHAGFVAVVGRPNVGKSTFINALLGQKVAAVSPKAQTTRKTQLGIYTVPTAQIIFIDTPGIHKPVHKLGEYMNEAALDTLKDADVILWLVDASQMPDDEDEIVSSKLKEARLEGTVLLALNKVDLISGAALDGHQTAYLSLFPTALPFRISAMNAYGLPALTDAMIERLPMGSYFYSEDQVTDLYERDIAAELIREAALLHLRSEVPHALAVRIDEYKERGEEGAFIGATMMVERESQKGIVIGKGGDMLKLIGSTARQEIEKMSGRKVFLELRVKVNKNWRDDPFALKILGYVSESKKKK